MREGDGGGGGGLSRASVLQKIKAGEKGLTETGTPRLLKKRASVRRRSRRVGHDL